MKIMTFNLWNGNKYDERRASVIECVEKNAPDVIGFEEALACWREDFDTLLDGYMGIGEGRDGGANGESTPIYWRRDKFDLVECGTRWLSDTPTVVSKHPDCWCPRVFSYVKLRDRENGKMHYHLNTHLDNARADVREYQAKVLFGFASSLDAPAVITGDFNFEEDAEPAAYAIAASGRFADSKKIAEKAYSVNTYHAYGCDRNMIIDYCFADKSAFDVKSYRVIDEKYGGIYPSDHFPVLVELTLK